MSQLQQYPGSTTPGRNAQKANLVAPTAPAKFDDVICVAFHFQAMD